MTEVRFGETDGVGWMRRAATILLEHGLPSFPRRTDDASLWHWHAAPDVASQLRSLHFAGQPAPTYDETLYGYRVDVDEAYPAGTLNIVREDPVVVTVVVNPPETPAIRS